MPTTSAPAETALSRCPGPITTMSISPPISAATATDEVGIWIKRTSRPYLRNRPRSLATHMAAMLSLVMLVAKLLTVTLAAPASDFHPRSRQEPSRQNTLVFFLRAIFAPPLRDRMRWVGTLLLLYAPSPPRQRESEKTEEPPSWRRFVRQS